MTFKPMLPLSLLLIVLTGLLIWPFFPVTAGGGGGTTTPRIVGELQTQVWAEYTQTAIALTPEYEPTLAALRQNAALTMTATQFTLTPTPILTALPSGVGRLAVLLAQPVPGSPDSVMGRLYLVDGNGQLSQALSPLGEAAWNPLWSPDGQALFYKGETGVFRVDVETGIRETLAAPELQAGANFTLSPDGRYLAYEVQGEDGQTALYLYDLTRQTNTSLIETGVNFALAWSPDSQHLAFISNRESQEILETQVWLINIETNTLQRLISDDSAGLYPPSSSPIWSPDGATVAYSSGGGLILVDVESGSPRPLTVNGLAAYNPQWPPDGALIAFVTYETQGMALYSLSLADESVQPITHPAQYIFDYHWSGDGRFLAFIGEDNYLYVVDRHGRLARPVVGDVPNAYTFAWQPE